MKRKLGFPSRLYKERSVDYQLCFGGSETCGRTRRGLRKSPNSKLSFTFCNNRPKDPRCN